MPRNISETIKGVLITLIVMGHVHAFDFSLNGNNLRSFLYCFHVFCFFILPFFYVKETNFSFPLIRKTFISTWTPYTLSLILCAGASFAVGKELNFGWETLYAYINGTQTPLAKCFGFIFPWFLPTYCSFILIYYGIKNKSIAYYTLTLISIATFFLDFRGYSILKEYLPFALGLAIRCFAYGVITVEIYKRLKYSKYIGSSLFIVLSILWWNRIDAPVVMLLLPVSFFFLIYLLSPTLDSRLFRSLGSHSLYIYIYNVFIINVLEKLLPSDQIGGLITFVTALSVSWGMAIITKRLLKYINTVTRH